MLKHNGNLSYYARKIGSRIRDHYSCISLGKIKQNLQQKLKVDHIDKDQHKRIIEA